MSGALLVFAIATLVASVSCVRAAERHTGRVTHVVDGQSVDVLVNAQRLRVRLAGIDAPPQGQIFGLRSRQSLVQICIGERATVEAAGKSRSGKGSLVGHVACGGTDAASEQIRRGMARVSAHADSDFRLRALEDEARAAHRGVWSTQARAGSP